MKFFFKPIVLFSIILSSFISFPRNSNAQDHIDPSIIGGVEATPGAWPFMVAILSANVTPLFNGQFCGGALISNGWVVSAAHCFTDVTAEDVQVGVNLHNLSTDSGEIINVTQIISHPDYDPDTNDNDIALLRLASNSTTGTPISIISDSINIENFSATAIGWGLTIDGDDSSASEVLRQVTMPVVSNETCYAALSGGITANMVCAGLAEGGKDACQGDSGGPLIVSSGGSNKLIGVTSFGIGCGQPNSYGVWARTSRYASFISTNTGIGSGGGGGVDEGEELEDDGESNYGLWNGFLGMTNILELVNRSNSSAQATVKFFNINGFEESSISYTVAAGSQLDVILNSVPGFIADSFGVVQVSDNVEGRIFYYRPTGGAFSNFEYAFGIPLATPTTGNTTVGYNTFQPSNNLADGGSLVANWLSIVNLDSSSRNFRVKKYDSAGTLLTNDQYSVSPGNRLDLDGGHVNPGPSNVGLIKIEPSSGSVKYIAQLMRYGYNQNGGLDFAFPLISKSGASSAISVPLGSTFNAQNWLEVVNSGSATGNVYVQFYDANGTLLHQEPLSLAPYAQRHIDATGILGAGALGMAVITPSGSARAVAQSMLYFRDQTTGGIQAMYGSQARAASTSTVNGSFNLFLGMENYLKLSNTSTQAVTSTVTISSAFSGGATVQTSIPAKGSVELPLHEFATYGTVADSYGVVTIAPGGQALVTENLRLLRNATGVEFAAPTGLQ